MKKGSLTITLCIISIYIVAQKRYYTSSAYQITAHNKKREFVLSVGKGHGYDFNASYSISDRFCLQVAYCINKQFEKRSTLFSSYGIQNNNYSLMSRLGFFRKLNKKGLGIIESYIGFSKVSINNYWDFTEINPFQPGYAEYTKAGYSTIFAGADASTYIKPVELALSLRCNFYKYASFQFFENNPSDYFPVSTLDNFKGGNAEVVLSLGFKHKKIKFSVQGGGSIPVWVPFATQTDLHRFYFGTETVIHKEKFGMASFISRLSLQYNLKK